MKNNPLQFELPRFWHPVHMRNLTANDKGSVTLKCKLYKEYDIYTDKINLSLDDILTYIYTGLY